MEVEVESSIAREKVGLFYGGAWGGWGLQLSTYPFPCPSFALPSFTVRLEHICQLPKEQDTHYQFSVYKVDVFDLG